MVFDPFEEQVSMAKSYRPPEIIGKLCKADVLANQDKKLDWIARLTSHIPNDSAQPVHSYGVYSNAHRGKTLHRQEITLPKLRSAT